MKQRKYRVFKIELMHHEKKFSLFKAYSPKFIKLSKLFNKTRIPFSKLKLINKLPQKLILFVLTLLSVQKKSKAIIFLVITFIVSLFEMLRRTSEVVMVLDCLSANSL